MRLLQGCWVVAAAAAAASVMIEEFALRANIRVNFRLWNLY
jgi:hypothetical protein